MEYSNSPGKKPKMLQEKAAQQPPNENMEPKEKKEFNWAEIGVGGMDDSPIKTKGDKKVVEENHEPVVPEASAAVEIAPPRQEVRVVIELPRQEVLVAAAIAIPQEEKTMEQKFEALVMSRGERKMEKLRRKALKKQTKTALIVSVKNQHALN